METIKTIKTVARLKGEVFEKFLNLASQLSPENLCCDGEASQTYINQKLRRINKEWKTLEKQIGRKVTEDEVWDTHMENYRNKKFTND